MTTIKHDKLTEVAAAVLLRETAQGTEYLLACRPEGKVYAGYWGFPGGKVEPGETLREALQRELHEELGITIERIKPGNPQQTGRHERLRGANAGDIAAGPGAEHHQVEVVVVRGCLDRD